MQWGFSDPEWEILSEKELMQHHFSLQHLHGELLHVKSLIDELKHLLGREHGVLHLVFFWKLYSQVIPVLTKSQVRSMLTKK